MAIELISKDWGKFAEKLRQNGYALLQAANPKLVVTDKGAADPNVIAATLLCRSLTHLKAVPILLNERLIVEARTIVRNCLENAFWLAAIAELDKRDEALRRMGDAELFTRHQIGEFAMQSVKGTKLWAGDCTASEQLRSSVPAETSKPPLLDRAAGAIPPGQK
jgi:hypothetical protein